MLLLFHCDKRHILNIYQKIATIVESCRGSKKRLNSDFIAQINCDEISNICEKVNEI
jgi:hypothetical protein